MATTPTALAQELRSVIVQNLLFGQGDGRFTDDDSLVEKGVIDSTSVLELVQLLEQRYSIVVADEEIIPENLDSIRNLREFVEFKVRQFPRPESSCR